MRQPTDLCLLCQVSPAIKTNSHIFPKFLSTNFLGPKGLPRKGYDLDSSKLLTTKPKIIQDSPKENYILCNDCEAYFSILEGQSASTFINWNEKVIAGHFHRTTYSEDFSVVTCQTSNPKTIRLLVYSIYWRAAVAGDELFDNLNIPIALVENLRKILMEYKSATVQDYAALLEHKPQFHIYPYTTMTADTFTVETANSLFAFPNVNPWSLNVDRFHFVLFETVNHMPEGLLKNESNKIITDNKLMVLSNVAWHQAVALPPLEMVADQAEKTK